MNEFKFGLGQTVSITASLESGEVIARAEKLAEEKELSPEPLNVDIVQALDRIVEETLGRKIIPPGEK